MLERSFLDALKADPGDTLARAAYADWLEEQADPRAVFLRAEADLFRDGHNPAAFLALSVLCEDIGSGWLHDVSLMAVAVRQAWQRIAPSFRSTAPAEISGDRDKSAALISEAFGGRDFLVPYDYALFQGLFSDGWFREGGRDEELAIWSGVMVRQRTRDWYEMEAIDPSRERWLSIGSPYSDHEEHFLCCSPSSPRFGQVVLIGDDMHPAFMEPPEVEYLASCHVEYLRRLAPR